MVTAGVLARCSRPLHNNFPPLHCWVAAHRRRFPYSSAVPSSSSHDSGGILCQARGDILLLESRGINVASAPASNNACRLCGSPGGR